MKIPIQFLHSTTLTYERTLSFEKGETLSWNICFDFSFCFLLFFGFYKENQEYELVGNNARLEVSYDLDTLKSSTEDFSANFSLAFIPTAYSFSFTCVRLCNLVLRIIFNVWATFISSVSIVFCNFGVVFSGAQN